MAILNTSVESNNTLYTFSPGDAYAFLTASAYYIYNGGAYAIVMGGTNNRFTVAGTLIANAGTGVLVSGTGSHTINVLAGGVISTAGLAIQIENDPGFSFVTIINSGTIEGSNGIVGFANRYGVVENSGLIRAHNVGGSAVAFGDQGDRLINTGTIIGTVFGYGGNDVFDHHLGQILGTTDGGAGDDLYIIAGTERLYEAPNGGIDVVESYADYALANDFENLTLRGAARIGTGNRLNNVIFGNNLGNTISGGAGFDQITAGTGDDIIRGGAGNDVIVGGDGGTDRLSGNAGDDIIVAGSEASTLDGGNGLDIVAFLSNDTAVVVDIGAQTFTGGNAALHTYKSFEGAFGSTFNDTLTGSATRNILLGFDGNDTLTGLGGDDSLEGLAGADTMDGGDGIDTAEYIFSSTAISINLRTGVGTLGDSAGDILISIENATGGSGDDTITGSNDANTLKGGDGLDNLLGSGGNDILIGGRGNDSLTGGLGADTFAFPEVTQDQYTTPPPLVVTPGGWGNDTINDFQDNIDKISFVGSTSVTTFANLTITLVGSSSLITTPDGDTITVVGIAPASLTVTDFQFG